MKKLITLLLFGISHLTTYSQSLSPAPTSEAGVISNAQGGNPMLNLVMMDLRANKNSLDINKTFGSPYSTENFIKSKIYYNTVLQGEFYVRYNALNSIIEIKKTALQEEEPNQLLADKNVTVKYLNKELKFTTYITKKNETKNGYLALIYSGTKFKLYHRLAVKFAEGKSAANSMVAAIPSRYVHFNEYFFQKEGVSRIDYLPLIKGKFLKKIDKPIRESLKMYIKENSYSLSNEEDLIMIFKQINIFLQSHDNLN